MINRSDGNKLWIPVKCSRVCSVHFVDGKPTEAHPYPTEKLGYDAKRKVANITSMSSSIGFQKPKRRKSLLQPRVLFPNNQQPTTSTFVLGDICDIAHDHAYFSSTISNGENVENSNMESTDIITEQDDNYLLFSVLFSFAYFTIYPIINVIFFMKSIYMRKIMYIKNLCDTVNILRAQVESLREENLKLREELDGLRKAESMCRCKKPLHQQLFKSDGDVKFYTGIASFSLFTKLHEKISPFVRQLWKGPKVTSTKIKRKFRQSVPNRMGPSRKLHDFDQFLLMLMKIRLNMQMHDLADRFNISTSLCSSLFTSWSKAAAMVLGSVVFMPDQGRINETKPRRFSAVKNLNCIIDCSEIFTETPKDHRIQRLLWSSYKHHNTLKFLIGVAPNSFISFLSKAYCGSISDKEICIQSDFFNKIEAHCSIMADKGFHIEKECNARSIHVIIPPGKRGHAQMLTGDVIKTKLVAQLRILVEQVIRRLKCFRMLSQELPVNLVHHIDDVLIICAGLCNLQNPIMK